MIITAVLSPCHMDFVEKKSIAARKGLRPLCVQGTVIGAPSIKTKTFFPAVSQPGVKKVRDILLSLTFFENFCPVRAAGRTERFRRSPALASSGAAAS